MTPARDRAGVILFRTESVLTGLQIPRILITLRLVDLQLGNRTMDFYSTLHRWVKASNHDEDFVASALFHLLDTALRREPELGLALLSVLTGGKLQLTQEDIPDLTIRDHPTTAIGIPDIEIAIRQTLVYVEVKKESPVDLGQLEKYKRHLSTISSNPLLVLLTHYAETVTADASRPDVYSRFYRLIDVMREGLSDVGIGDPVCQFLCSEFRLFAVGLGLWREAVNRDLASNQHGRETLWWMIAEAFHSAFRAGVLEHAAGNPRTNRRYTWVRVGQYLDSMMISASPNQPDILRLEIWKRAIPPNIRLGCDQGEFFDAPNGASAWTGSYDLNDSGGEFFRMTPAQQLTRIEDLVFQVAELRQRLGRAIPAVQ